MKKLLIIPVLLTGCALTPGTNEEIAKYIDTYCLNTDEVLRASVRNEINSLTKIGDIEVTCD